MRFSKKVIIVMFLSVFAFVTVMILTYWFKGGVPDTLVDRFFAFFGIEGGALGIIKVAETWAESVGKRKVQTKRKENGK
ncbi:MAG: hypothetical protein ACI4RV_04270 [Eubacteriales bacterium]